MPRIDPAQLLKCLSVLLSPDGGIKSKLEVQRLAGLMGKFSKKLVSKCIYLQILKKTETELLGAFMASNGWSLVHTWLDDGIKAKNWPLIEELLELLLLCPVHVEILKTNNCPKLVKELSKLTDQDAVQTLAAKVVGQWLKLVKGEAAPPSALEQNSQSSNDKTKNQENDYSDKITDVVTSSNEIDSKDNPLPILKISVKDGKQVVSKVTEKTDRKSSDKIFFESNCVTSSTDNNEKDSEKNKKKKDSAKISSSSDRSNSSNSSSTLKNKLSTSERRHSSSSSNNSDSSKSKHKSKSSSGHRDSDKKNSSKSRNEKHRDSDKAKDRSEKSREHSDKRKEHSDKNKESSDKSKDHLSKNKETPKVETLSIMKLGKIPKKSSASKSEVKKEKPSISIEVRNPNDANRPKTVKMFNSKFRSHGLEEEAKPPPPRGSVKKPAVPTGLPTAQKRPSPIRTFDAPPEKKPKIAENVERPGAIKLIPPKPKPAYLLESGSFMDALTASATNKKEPRKRKRRISGSKDNSTSGDGSPPASPTTPQTPTSPTVEESKSTPLRFYQDTLDTEEEDKDKENRSKSPTEDVKDVISESPMSPCDKEDANISIKLDINEDDPPPPVILPGGLRSVLSVHKRKGPKKTLTWRTEIQDVQYFELDETERVNVTKTFLAMKQMEHIHERESFKKGRNIANEDFMEEKTPWSKLIPIDVEKVSVVHPGHNSKEKEIQKARQEKVLAALYFHSKIPDSPAEADHEIHPVSEPAVIPLEDVTGASESVNNFQNTPWPEPKTTPPAVKPNPGMPNPQIFPNGPPFNQGFNGIPFGMPGPGYQQGMMPPMGGGEWSGNGPNMMMNEGMSNPDMFMGPGSGPGPVMGPGSMFPGQANEYPMMDGGAPAPSGFQPGFNNQMGPGGPPMGMNRPMGPYGFKNRGGIRGPAPRGGHMGWRSKGPGNWSGPHRGGSVHRGNGRLCTHFQKKGFCRHGDSCPFVHSGGGRPHY